MSPRRSRNPADQVLRVRLREAVQFPDLSERRALKLNAVLHYVARAHFGLWHRRFGGHDFHDVTGVFTPLFLVDVATTDLPLNPMLPLEVRGETVLAKTLDANGEIDHIVREGRHTLLAPDDGGLVGQARLINVFTRYDSDPARRRVTSLPAHLGLGEAPERVTELPDLATLVPEGRRPDFSEDGARVWHYGQTDSNRHVNGMEYLRMMECYVAEALQQAGHDLRRLYFARARIIYRKPCFRGEGYRRVAWIRGEAPLTITGAFYKAGAAAARPAVAVELTVMQHAEAE
ncbi:MAG TPA: hypothetical protein VL403_17640 [Candidatus Kryptonia bacterium]|nr:hypothetical protein [Candidatus Kryptonia bacterium]